MNNNSWVKLAVVSLSGIVISLSILWGIQQFNQSRYYNGYNNGYKTQQSGMNNNNQGNMNTQGGMNMQQNQGYINGQQMQQGQFNMNGQQMQQGQGNMNGQQMQGGSMMDMMKSMMGM